MNIPDLGEMLSARLGPGVIGRTAPVALAYLVFSIFAIYFLRENVYVASGIFGITTLAFFGYIFASFWYANKYPVNAILDGSDFVRHAELQQSASDPKIVDAAAKPIANTAAPQSIRIEGPR